MSMHVEQAGVFTDLAGLQKIKNMPKAESDEALVAVAKQFESIFVNMMLKSMRDTNAVFEEDNFMHSSESNFYRDMMDNQLGVSLSEGRGIGLADVLVRQLKHNASLQRGASGVDAEAAAQKAAEVSEKGLDRLDQIQFLRRLQEASNRFSEPKTQAVGSGDTPKFDSPEAFANYLYPLAEKASAKLKLDPKFLVSQAALETGWGQHMIKTQSGENSYNLFGIKADERWNGDVAQVSTLEYRDGVAVKEKANFRAYDSLEDSLNDYVDFIQSQDRYSDALSVAAQGSTNSGAEYMQALQSAGYATDPNYARKVNAIADQPMLALLGGAKR